MGPAEPVRPAHSAPGSAALGAGKTAAPAKRVAPATCVASPPGISRSVGNKNSSENVTGNWKKRLRQMDHLRSGVQDQPGQHGETSSLPKIQKISQVRCWAPVIPATRESEAEQLLEPGDQELQLGDSRQRRHTGRQRHSFGRCGRFAGAPARRFPVRSIWDGWARLVPSPQGKQQLEALRTESFTASTANPGRSGSVGNKRPPKEN
ncbi:hypothetical protein AAY473_007956 [Plecturocebus cupreus]